MKLYWCQRKIFETGIGIDLCEIHPFLPKNDRQKKIFKLGGVWFGNMQHRFLDKNYTPNNNDWSYFDNKKYLNYNLKLIMPYAPFHYYFRKKDKEKP